MQSLRPGGETKIKFRYLAEHDAVLATVNFQLETLKDVDEWLAAYTEYFSGHHRGEKVDLILDLSKFTISPRVGAAFGEARAKVVARYTKRTYRVNVDAAT